MVLGQYRRGIGVFSRRQDAEYAMRELQEAGFPMDRVSVIAKDLDHKDFEGTDLNKKSGNEAGEGAAIGSVTGTALGMLGGLLAGLGSLVIPGVGPVVAAGSIGTTLATTLAGGGIGAVSGGLVGALAGMGVPGHRAKVYSDRLSQGDYLVIIEGRSDEIMRAEAMLLNNRGIEEWGIYDAHKDDPAALNLQDKQAQGY
ncbi:MAG: hypothetical protein KME06_01640 [Kastovskya adunca ATA6-11-RM4]|jgi:hypothetical protein|nr:hypothetical protein [Kastovskya adunca ATA6-11-RM4]